MITLTDFRTIDTNVKNAINTILDNIKNNSISNYVYFLAYGEYLKYLADGGKNPHVIDYRRDIYQDETRLDFLTVFLNNYYAFNKGSISIPFKEVRIEDDATRINLELMIYSHTWESERFLKTMYRLGLLVNNISYSWKVTIPLMGKSEFIEKKIIKKIKANNNCLGNLIDKTYYSKLRNAFAHASYVLDPERKIIRVQHYDKMKKSVQIEDITFDKWSEIFVHTFLLTYHLLNIVQEKRLSIITDLGTDLYNVRLPNMNHNVNIRYTLKTDSFSFER